MNDSEIVSIYLYSESLKVLAWLISPTLTIKQICTFATDYENCWTAFTPLPQHPSCHSVLMYSIYLNIYKHTFYYSNLIQLVACVSNVRDILLLSRLSISDSSLSPASLSAPTFILWPVIMTSMIDSGLLVAQEFQLAQEETLRFKRSSFIVGLPIFCPRPVLCQQRSWEPPGTGCGHWSHILA